jgi:methylmalonyl-CoA decarboxylase
MDRALQISILNHLYVSGELEAKTYKMVGAIASRSPKANSVLKGSSPNALRRWRNESCCF